MPHLSPERLAALADSSEVPEPDEALHLAHCDVCATERLTYGVLVSGASEERRAIAEPLTTWDGIAAGLRAEGLLKSRGVGRWPSARATRTVRVAAGIAAGFALVAGGVAAGRMSAIAGPLAVTTPAGAPATAGGRVETAAAAGIVADYQTAADAEAALARFEVAYQHAAAYLAGNDSSPHLDAAADYRTRLAALDRTTRTMREAMEQAPYDPVLTGYYLTTLGQREATLRQLNVAVPAGARLNSF